MSFSHLTLPTRDVQRTASFLLETFGYSRNPVPGNTPMQAAWLDIGRGQELHVIYLEDFEVSPFESEFGRHIAVFFPLRDFGALKQRLADRGAVFLEQMRTVPYQRFFFREPVNGYVFEVIDEDRALTPSEP
jgi:hypothetical protein